MKKTILALIATALFCSCTKQQVYIYPEKKCKDNILGKWVINEDEKRYITIDSINSIDSICYVTFPQAIDAPIGKAHVQYSIKERNDTLILTHQYFYPPMRFFTICEKYHGKILEWQKMPSQGQWLKIQKQ